MYYYWGVDLIGECGTEVLYSTSLSGFDRAGDTTNIIGDTLMEVGLDSITLGAYSPHIT